MDEQNLQRLEKNIGITREELVLNKKLVESMLIKAN